MKKNKFICKEKSKGGENLIKRELNLPHVTLQFVLR